MPISWLPSTDFRLRAFCLPFKGSVPPNQPWVVYGGSGGGVHNPVLMDHCKRFFQLLSLHAEALGIPYWCQGSRIICLVGHECIAENPGQSFVQRWHARYQHGQNQFTGLSAGWLSFAPCQLNLPSYYKVARVPKKPGSKSAASAVSDQQQILANLVAKAKHTVWKRSFW